MSKPYPSYRRTITNGAQLQLKNPEVANSIIYDSFATKPPNLLSISQITTQQVTVRSALTQRAVQNGMRFWQHLVSCDTLVTCAFHVLCSVKGVACCFPLPPWVLFFQATFMIGGITRNLVTACQFLINQTSLVARGLNSLHAQENVLSAAKSFSNSWASAQLRGQSEEWLAYLLSSPCLLHSNKN